MLLIYIIVRCTWHDFLTYISIRRKFLNQSSILRKDLIMERININLMSDAGRLIYLIDLLQDITEALASRNDLDRSEAVLVEVATEAVNDYNQKEGR